MNLTAPHYLLLTQAQSNPDSQHPGGVWRFVLEQIGSSSRVEIEEEEPGVWGERLQLLAVVRGLEALEEPATVTLITPSRFVGNGIRTGINRWKKMGWRWEEYGKLVPVEHVDLWKRIDHALQFHQIACRIWDFVEPEFQARRPIGRNRISLGEIENARSRVSSEIRDEEAGASAGPAILSEPHSFSLSSCPSHHTRLAPPSPANGEPKYRVKPMGAGRAFGYAVN